MTDDYTIQVKRRPEPEASTAPITDFDSPPKPELDTDDLRRLLDWFGTPQARDYFGDAFILKSTALVWTFNPHHFNGKSLTTVADELGVSKNALSRYSAKVSRIYGRKNAAQVRHTSKKKRTSPKMMTSPVK